jgi:hypothetical protein
LEQFMNELISAYADAIRAVAASVHDVYDGEWGDREWERLVVDFESLAHVDEPRTSSISFAIARAPDGPLEKVSFSLSADAEEAFMRINRIMQAQKGNYWSTCQVMVERDGRYDLQFDYGPPYRLSGNLNDTRYRDYLDRYMAEMGQR